MTQHHNKQQSTNQNIDHNDFLTAYKGGFKGILRWPQLDDFWETVNCSEKDWYIYAVGGQPPQNSSNLASLRKFIKEVDALLRREHDEDYCGIVYTDDIQEPHFIKIFDPNNVGTSCSMAKTPPLPGWILSTSRPIDLPLALQQEAIAQPNNRKHWWNKLFN